MRCIQQMVGPTRKPTIVFTAVFKGRCEIKIYRMFSSDQIILAICRAVFLHISNVLWSWKCVQINVLGARESLLTATYPKDRKKMGFREKGGKIKRKELRRKGKENRKGKEKEKVWERKKASSGRRKVKWCPISSADGSDYVIVLQS